MKLIEFVPDKKVVWLVMDNYLSSQRTQRNGQAQRLVLRSLQKDNKTQIRVTHVGLVPEYECFDICSNAWTHYIQQSLSSLIATGKGMPNGKGKPSTDTKKNSHLARYSRRDWKILIRQESGFKNPGDLL